MNRRYRRRALSVHSLIISALLATAPGAVFAKNDSSGTPKNAHAKSYGIGWECDRGHREVKGACAVIKMPMNTYQPDSTYGRGWECLRGYLEINGSCSAVKIPSNGYLDSSGKGWKCERGFQSANDSCEAIKVPANGYLLDSSYGIGRGTGWKCNRGLPSRRRVLCDYQSATQRLSKLLGRWMELRSWIPQSQAGLRCRHDTEKRLFRGRILRIRMEVHSRL